MSELIQNTVKIVEEFNNRVKQDLSSKGIDNSRKASDSIHIETKQSGTSINIQSLGIDYLYYLDKGRGPGKFPPRDTIENWTISKPVDIPPFLVGRKISREGTEIYKDQSKGIQLTEKRKEVLKEIKQDAPKWAKQDLLIKLKGINKI